jgi:hypothetical protein
MLMPVASACNDRWTTLPCTAALDVTSWAMILSQVFEGMGLGAYGVAFYAGSRWYMQAPELGATGESRWAKPTLAPSSSLKSCCAFGMRYRGGRSLSRPSALLWGSAVGLVLLMPARFDRPGCGAGRPP